MYCSPPGIHSRRAKGSAQAQADFGRFLADFRPVFGRFRPLIGRFPTSGAHFRTPREILLWKSAAGIPWHAEKSRFIAPKISQIGHVLFPRGQLADRPIDRPIDRSTS